MPGCGPAPRNGCPSGQNCLDIVNGVGQCSGAMCHNDADCRQPLAHCDLTGGPDGHCVQCLFDTDCDAPLVCDPTKRKCLECTPSNATQCKPELAGSQCLVDGRCGCLADADCGGVTSGRVCDATVSRCVPGCRGTGGNGCPTEQVCSSTTAQIGRCDAAPPPDGGADAGRDGSSADARPDGTATDAKEAGAADSATDGVDAGSADSGTPGDASAADAGSDAGTAPVGVDRFIAGGGCHCATAPSGATPWLGGLMALALAIATVRRRRR